MNQTTATMSKATTCPHCSRTHARGPVNGSDVYRCLHCGRAYKAIAGVTSSFSKALEASDATAHLVAMVRANDREKAVVYIELVVHALARLLNDYGLELGEVAPLVTCTRCERPALEYRRYGSEALCVMCINEHLGGATSTAELREQFLSKLRNMAEAEAARATVQKAWDLDKARLREATALLSDVAAPFARVTAFLDEESKR